MNEDDLAEFTHILYLSDKKWVCEDPDRLGYDFVVSGVGDAERLPCKECTQLLIKFNTLEDHYGVVYVPENKPTRGVLIGAAFSSLFWLIAIVMLFIIALR